MRSLLLNLSLGLSLASLFAGCGSYEGSDSFSSLPNKGKLDSNARPVEEDAGVDPAGRRPSGETTQFPRNPNGTETTPKAKLPTGSIVIADDGKTDSPVGNVYKLASGTSKLPDFSKMKPITTVLIPNFDIASRSFTQGFPNLPDLFEWFGIQFNSRIKVPVSGTYRFFLNSDDGANLYINGTKVIDNDGLHQPLEKEGDIYLRAGTHAMRIDYYQGPREKIALQLFWTVPGGPRRVIVPEGVLSRP